MVFLALYEIGSASLELL